MAERTTRRALLLAAATMPLLAVGGQAVADPLYPSQDQVDGAKAAADATAAQVAGLQAQLSAQQAWLDQAQTALSVAAEDYDEARALLAQRTQEADAATAAATAAREAYDQARIALGRVASEQYRGSADELSPLATVLASGSIEDYVSGRAAMDHLAGSRSDVKTEAAQAKVVADSAERAAADAQAAQTQATDAAEKARLAAQQAADAADALVASTRAQADTLIAQLAALQQTTVELEQQRQAGLEAERVAAAEAAARSAAGRSVPSGSVVRAAGPTAGADTAVDWAMGQLGKPYLWAGDGPDSFDCSGLTMRAWEAAGVSLPHSSRIQYSGEAKVALADLQPGDLVFYATNTSNPSTIHHVGMVISPGTMVEAPHTGANVRTSSIYRSGLMSYGTRPA